MKLFPHWNKLFGITKLFVPRVWTLKWLQTKLSRFPVKMRAAVFPWTESFYMQSKEPSVGGRLPNSSLANTKTLANLSRLFEEHHWNWMPHSVTEHVYWVQTMLVKGRHRRKACNERTAHSTCQNSRAVFPSLTQTFKPPTVNHEAHFSHHIKSSLTSEKESKLLTPHSLKQYWCGTIV